MQFRCYDEKENSVYQVTDPLVKTLKEELINSEGEEEATLWTKVHHYYPFMAFMIEFRLGTDKARFISRHITELHLIKFII